MAQFPCRLKSAVPLRESIMALNKSKSISWLGKHALVYSLPFLLWGWQFAILNGCLHFLVDFLTSKGTAQLWLKGSRYWFFALIGFDQAIHISILVLTLKLFS